MPLHKNIKDEFNQPTITGKLLYIRTNGRTYTEEFSRCAKHLVVNKINSLVDKLYSEDVVKIDIDIQETKSEEVSDKTYVYILKDEPLQGMKDFGIIGIYSSLKKAEEAKGSNWYSIHKHEVK